MEGKAGAGEYWVEGEALNLALNCVEFRANHEPCMVHGMVQG